MPSLMEHLKALAARIRRYGPFPPPGLPPLDDEPDTRVRQPRGSSPGGRQSAVALDEPSDAAAVDARGRRA